MPSKRAPMMIIAAASPRERTAVERRAVRDTVVALAIATAINGSILIVGSAVGARTVESAFATLAPVAGAGSALLFGIALIAAVFGRRLSRGSVISAEAA